VQAYYVYTVIVQSHCIVEHTSKFALVLLSSFCSLSCSCAKLEKLVWGGGMDRAKLGVHFDVQHIHLVNDEAALIMNTLDL
jgi:hypothetical protein